MKLNFLRGPATRVFTCIYKTFRDTFSIASYIEFRKIDYKHSKTHAYSPSFFGQDG